MTSYQVNHPQASLPQWLGRTVEQPMRSRPARQRPPAPAHLHRPGERLSFDAHGIGGEGSDAGGSVEADSGRTGLKVPNELELLGGARPTGSGGALAGSAVRAVANASGWWGVAAVPVVLRGHECSACQEGDQQMCDHGPAGAGDRRENRQDEHGDQQRP